MAESIMLQQAFRLMTCPICGIGYALPEWYITTRQDKGGTWSCPNGHSLSFTVTENDRLKAQLAEKQRLLMPRPELQTPLHESSAPHHHGAQRYRLAGRR